MNAPRFDEADEKLVADLLEARIGFDVGGVRHPVFVSRLEGRLQATGAESLGEYYRYLRFTADGAEELDRLVLELLNNETYFFREAGQLDVLVEHALPEWRRRNPGARFRVLSAGCSSGEEVYSIAIRLAESSPAGTRWRIDGWDLDSRRLEQARRASYNETSLRRIDPFDRPRWFESACDRWSVRAPFRENVDFTHRNLIDGIRDDERFDVVFCRNVLIYFSDAARQRTIGLLARRLVPGGWLFLGHAESILEQRHDLEPVTLGRRVVYRKREGGA